MNWKDIGIRAGKTFIQAFIAALVASPLFDGSGFNYGALGAALLAGLAAVISAFQNSATAAATK